MPCMKVLTTKMVKSVADKLLDESELQDVMLVLDEENAFENIKRAKQEYKNNIKLMARDLLFGWFSKISPIKREEAFSLMVEALKESHQGRILSDVLGVDIED